MPLLLAAHCRPLVSLAIRMACNLSHSVRTRSLRDADHKFEVKVSSEPAERRPWGEGIQMGSRLSLLGRDLAQNSWTIGGHLWTAVKTTGKGVCYLSCGLNLGWAGTFLDCLALVNVI